MIAGQRSQFDTTNYSWNGNLQMLKNLAIGFGLLAGLSASVAPYGYPGYGYSGYPAPGYGYSQPPYSAYSNEPVYYGPSFPPTSPHGTVQP